MKVRRLGWVGTRTNEFQATARFFSEVLGLAPTYEEPDFATFALPGGTRDMVEVIGPNVDASVDSVHFTTGPVVGFVVDDILVARSELADAGVELLGEIGWSTESPGYGWFNFRAPDGNVYGMLQGTRALPETDRPRPPDQQEAPP
jgi:catechol 2,3-dioxygenase-like lactoylglutathione lyase family enzyme